MSEFAFFPAAVSKQQYYFERLRYRTQRLRFIKVSRVPYRRAIIMTGLIGTGIWIVTAWLSLRYRPAERDSLIMMGLCLFCGLIAMLSGVRTLNLTGLTLLALGIILLGLYRGQLRSRYDGNESYRETLPLSEDDPEKPVNKNKDIVA